MKIRSAAWLSATLLLVFSALAQEPTPAGSMPAEQEQTADTTSAPFGSMHNMLTGEILDSPYSPLHFGKISVLSVSATQYYDFNYAFDSANQQDARATELSALLVYTIQKKRFEFSVQYRPAVWFTDSGNEVDLSNQMFDSHSTFQVKPRWTMTLGDSFLSIPYRGAVADGGLISIAQNGTLFNNPFVATEQRMNTNLFVWQNQYDVGGRDKITFGAGESYQSTSQGSANTPYVIGPGSNGVNSSSNDVSGTLGYSHEFSSRMNAGVTYMWDYDRFGPIQTHTQRNSIEPNFTRILGHDFRVSAGLGFTYANSKLANGPNATQRSYIGNASIQKSFRNSQYAISWSRSNQFAGLISNSLNDRVDFTAMQTVHRKLQLSAQIGYLTQQFAEQPGAHSWMGVTSAHYSLDRHWSLMASFMYLGESGLFNLPYEARKTVSFGPHWDWGGQDKELQPKK